jgi:hypothetical protein
VSCGGIRAFRQLDMKIDVCYSTGTKIPTEVRVLIYKNWLSTYQDFEDMQIKSKSNLQAAAPASFKASALSRFQGVNATITQLKPTSATVIAKVTFIPAMYADMIAGT